MFALIHAFIIALLLVFRRIEAAKLKIFRRRAGFVGSHPPNVLLIPDRFLCPCRAAFLLAKSLYSTFVRRFSAANILICRFTGALRGGRYFENREFRIVLALRAESCIAIFPEEFRTTNKMQP